MHAHASTQTLVSVTLTYCHSRSEGPPPPEPACSEVLSSEHLAGPLPLPRGHHQTQRSKRPPEVWLAKEFLKWILGCASHKRTGKE